MYCFVGLELILPHIGIHVLIIQLIANNAVSIIIYYTFQRFISISSLVIKLIS